MTVFWLSHHFPDRLHRCYRVGGVHVCARCLGTYPVMLAAIVAQVAAHAPLSHPWDLPVGVGLLVPAGFDWVLGRFWPRLFGNPWRTFTGALMGLGLGRSLFIHLLQPFPALLWAQIGLVTAVSLPVILATYRRPPGR